MELYQQETELSVLLQMCAGLRNKIAIDVGAEQGSFTAEFLRTGCTHVYTFEPWPPNADYLRQRFRDNPEVRVFETALSVSDKTAALHVAQDSSGQVLRYYHSLESFKDTPQVRWGSDINVPCRSLGSLVSQGTIPSEVGVLKIDTEGHDFAVLQGLGALASDIIMVECWDELPQVIGSCPYRLSQVAGYLRERGYLNFAFFKRFDEFEAVQINHSQTRPGEWGNVLFLHEDVFDQLAPVLYAAAAAAQSALIDRALYFRSECHQRLATIEELDRECRARLKVIETLDRERRKSSNS